MSDNSCMAWSEMGLSGYRKDISDDCCEPMSKKRRENVRDSTGQAEIRDMRSNFLANSLLIAVVAGCAAQPPVPFQLVDQQSVAHAGVFHTQDQSVDVAIAGKNFHGFYIVETGTAVGTSDVLFSRSFHTVETFSRVSSNSARAVLKAADGESITCEFLFQGMRAVGDCRSSTGKVYQMVATGI